MNCVGTGTLPQQAGKSSPRFCHMSGKALRFVHSTVGKVDPSPNHEQPRGRVLRVPVRKGIWLFEYKDIKYHSRLQWSLHLISGLAALIFGSVFLAALIVEGKRGKWEPTSILIAICVLSWGLIYAPAAIIYFIRRCRGELTDFFDNEVVERGRHTSLTSGDSDAPDHR